MDEIPHAWAWWLIIAGLIVAIYATLWLARLL